MLAVWVGTQKETTISAVKVNGVDASDLAALIVGKIPISIGSTTANNPYFFHDDVDNKLIFVSDLSAGAASRLTVTDGEMKVTLLGKKTTYYDDDDEGDIKSQNDITVQLLARDDGGLSSDDEDDVLTVHIDAAPTTKGNIGTKVITLGTTLMDRVAVPSVRSYFTDDRHDPTQEGDVDLVYYVWSSNSEVASVSINSGNGDDVVATFVDVMETTDGNADARADDGFWVEGKGRGSAMIMVKAQEAEGAGTVDDFTAGVPETNGHGRLEQSVTLTFMVEVK